VSAIASKTRELTSAAAAFVYSELELRGEVIAVLFDARDEAVTVPADSVRKVVRRQS
jgi:hypothetical protein